jgi:hypothetical protein
MCGWLIARTSNCHVDLAGRLGFEPETRGSLVVGSHLARLVLSNLLTGGVDLTQIDGIAPYTAPEWCAGRRGRIAMYLGGLS